MRTRSAWAKAGPRLAQLVQFSPEFERVFWRVRDASRGRGDLRAVRRDIERLARHLPGRIVCNPAAHASALGLLELACAVLDKLTPAGAER